MPGARAVEGAGYGARYISTMSSRNSEARQRQGRAALDLRRLRLRDSPRLQLQESQALLLGGLAPLSLLGYDEQRTVRRVLYEQSAWVLIGVLPSLVDT